MFVITTELVEALIVFQDLKAPIGLLNRGSMFETGRATMTSPTVLYICMYIIVRIYIYIYICATSSFKFNQKSLAVKNKGSRKYQAPKECDAKTVS